MKLRMPIIRNFQKRAPPCKLPNTNHFSIPNIRKFAQKFLDMETYS